MRNATKEKVAAKPKSFQFLVTVNKAESSKSALNAILCAFAMRNPDGCEFITKRYLKPSGIRTKSNETRPKHKQ